MEANPHAGARVAVNIRGPDASGIAVADNTLYHAITSKSEIGIGTERISEVLVFRATIVVVPSL